MSSNRGEKVLNIIEIGWTQDLRVQHNYYNFNCRKSEKLKVRYCLIDQATTRSKSGGCLIDEAPAGSKSGSGLIDQAATRSKSGDCLIDQAAARSKSGAT